MIRLDAVRFVSDLLGKPNTGRAPTETPSSDSFLFDRTHVDCPLGLNIFAAD